MKHTYRLVVMNNETFEEVGSYRLTLLNVYIFVSTLLVLLAFLVVLAVAFTPLKRYIPGYGEGGDNREEVEQLYREVKKMEKQLAAQEKYATNFHKVLVGDVETAEDVIKSDPGDTVSEVQRSQEEEQLRQEMELQKVGMAAQRSRAANFSPGRPPWNRCISTLRSEGRFPPALCRIKTTSGLMCSLLKIRPYRPLWTATSSFRTGPWKPGIPSAYNMPIISSHFTNTIPHCSKRWATSSKQEKPWPSLAIPAPSPTGRTSTLSSGIKEIRLTLLIILSFNF